MIPDEGAIWLLNSQLTYISGLYWRLFVSNTTINNATTFGSLTYAGWTGYAHQLVGTMGFPTTVGGRAQTLPAGNPSFLNSSGSPVTFYGWALVDEASSALIAAVNLGATVIPDGQSYILAPAITDKEE